MKEFFDIFEVALAEYGSWAEILLVETSVTYRDKLDDILDFDFWVMLEDEASVSSSIKLNAFIENYVIIDGLESREAITVAREELMNNIDQHSQVWVRRVKDLWRALETINQRYDIWMQRLPLKCITDNQTPMLEKFFQTLPRFKDLVEKSHSPLYSFLSDAAGTGGIDVRPRVVYVLSHKFKNEDNAEAFVKRVTDLGDVLCRLHKNKRRLVIFLLEDDHSELRLMSEEENTEKPLHFLWRGKKEIVKRWWDEVPTEEKLLMDFDRNDAEQFQLDEFVEEFRFVMPIEEGKKSSQRLSKILSGRSLAHFVLGISDQNENTNYDQETDDEKQFEDVRYELMQLLQSKRSYLKFEKLKQLKFTSFMNRQEHSSDTHGFQYPFLKINTDFQLIFVIVKALLQNRSASQAEKKEIRTWFSVSQNNKWFDENGMWKPKMILSNFVTMKQEKESDPTYMAEERYLKHFRASGNVLSPLFLVQETSETKVFGNTLHPDRIESDNKVSRIIAELAETMKKRSNEDEKVKQRDAVYNKLQELERNPSVISSVVDDVRKKQEIDGDGAVLVFDAEMRPIDMKGKDVVVRASKMSEDVIVNIPTKDLNDPRQREMRRAVVNAVFRYHETVYKKWQNKLAPLLTELERSNLQLPAFSSEFPEVNVQKMLAKLKLKKHAHE